MQLPDTPTTPRPYQNQTSPGNQVKTTLLEFGAEKAKPFASYNDTINSRLNNFLYQLIEVAITETT
jgi:hypothetical protein